MNRNSRPQHHGIAPVIRRKNTKTCAFKDCQLDGEHHILGDAHLCTEHFLRDRVRLNLAALD